MRAEPLDSLYAKFFVCVQGIVLRRGAVQSAARNGGLVVERWLAGGRCWCACVRA